ncbi:hypothetical protein PV328_007513 [Microctonus aethiopoides]|uniref:G-protein coupled receptors family 1 profile domain-containing protein n=1 Tax=Microctonus aethiopoides TaxID=144406 RepID=A0AA39C937_9HYME|nr:hypothetical protein PV328_007513 [Microctonus aethiopoides]
MDGGATEIEEVESVEDLGHLEKWWNLPGIVLWSLILFGSFLLNATLLLAFLKRPGLRTISNRFVMNLSISNLLTVALINCLLLFDNEQSSSIHCSLSEGATALITTSSILSVLLIALDQYLAVVDPLRYRTRINKLKCGILIFTIWIVSIIFSLLAGFNPNPKSLWLACNNLSNNNSSLLKINNNSTLNFHKILIESKNNNSKTELFNNNLFIITYGFIYAITSGLIVYLLPFISVCWIYINIYLAAHKNSERTRRNGSRPILSTFNYSDDYYSPIRNDIGSSGDEIRRIPKISSLSSIDESIETATSQLPIQCSNKINKSINNNNNINNETVIFTVGEQKVDVKNNSDKIINKKLKNTKDIKVPIAVLKRKFLSKKYQKSSNRYPNDNINNDIKSHFNDDNEEKRKSSHDLMYDELMLENNYLELNKRDNNYLNDCSDSDDNDDDDNITINNVNNDIKYPPLMTKSDFKVMDDELMNEFKQKVQNSLSNKENILLLRNDGHNSNVNNHNCHLNDCNIMKISSDNLINSNNGINQTPIVTITPPNKISLQRVSSTRSTASYINCLKYRISNASLFKYREETRAARISALVIVMGFICWTPYFTLSIAKYITIIINNNHLSHDYDIVAMSLLIFATYVSPLLFGYRSRRVKRELRKFFCFQKELSYKNNRSLMAKKVLKRRHSGNLSHLEMDNKYNIFNCVYGRNKWPKEKVQFVQVPDTALAVETCRSSFSSGASTQISSTSTDEN